MKVLLFSRSEILCLSNIFSAYPLENADYLTCVSQMGKSLFGVTVAPQALCKAKVSWQHGDNHPTNNGVVTCESIYWELMDEN